MTPWSAPDFYRYVFTLPAVMRNLAEYADRAVTLAALVTMLAVGVLGCASARPANRARRIVLCGFVWLVLGFAPTILLRVRSDLYACLPSIGACLAAGAIVSEAWTASSVRRRRRALLGAVVLLAVLAPIHYLRTFHWVRPADLSARVLEDLRTRAAALPDGARVVIAYDPSDPVSNLDDAFGSHLDVAFEVHTGRRISFSLSPAPGGAGPSCATCDPPRLAVVNGRLR